MQTYSVGYTFPIVSDGETVGVRFKAPIMPVTPSARVKIDYGSATVVTTTAEPETTQAQTTTQVTATTQASEAQTELQTTETTAVLTTAEMPVLTETETETENAATTSTTESVQNTSGTYSSEIKITVKWNALPVIMLFAIVICVAALLVIL